MGLMVSVKLTTTITVATQKVKNINYRKDTSNENSHYILDTAFP